MKRLLAALIILFYCNLVWQIMIWCFDLLHPVLGFLLFLVFPVIAAVLFSFLVNKLAGESWMIPVLVSAILFPALYGISHLTRMPDHILYVHSSSDVFRGDAAGIDRSNYVYYEIHKAAINTQEFGAAYGTTKPRQSTTTYYKYFAIPIRDAQNGEIKNVFLCGSKTSGVPIDNGAGGPYGIDETGLKNFSGADPVYARQISEMNCSRAAANYYEKTGQTAPQAPVILELESESAGHYYASARLHYAARLCLSGRQKV
jgi:hypothetical protein